MRGGRPRPTLCSEILGKTTKWPGQLRPSSRSASASRSTGTCRPSSDPAPLASVLNGATHRPRARLGGGRRLPSMQLSLPDMPFGMGGRCARAAARPSESCHQRRQRELAPDQGLPGPSSAGPAYNPEKFPVVCLLADRAIIFLRCLRETFPCRCLRDFPCRSIPLVQRERPKRSPRVRMRSFYAGSLACAARSLASAALCL